LSDIEATEHGSGGGGAKYLRLACYAVGGLVGAAVLALLVLLAVDGHPLALLAAAVGAVLPFPLRGIAYLLGIPRPAYRVKCPDGSMKLVYRNVDDAFPLVFRGLETEFYTAKGRLDALSASIDDKHRSMIESLLGAADEANNALMAKFRAAYLVYTTDPCSQSEYLATQLNQISEEYNRLTRVEHRVLSLISLVASKPTDTDSISSLSSELAGQLAVTP
jgi:hypothetical protein